MKTNMPLRKKPKLKFILLISLFAISCKNSTNDVHVFETNDETIKALSGIWVNENNSNDSIHFLFDNSGMPDGKYKRSGHINWEVYEPGEAEITIDLGYPDHGEYKVKMINKERMSIRNDIYVKETR